jgi:hypothetical protein
MIRSKRHYKSFDRIRNNTYNDYEYDDLDRLAVATYINDANEVFTMDDLGNRQSVNLRSGGTQTYTVDDDNNQYTAIDSSSLTGACPCMSLARNAYGNGPTHMYLIQSYFEKFV